MDVKETLKSMGKGMCIRRAASKLAHGSDYKKYISDLPDFSANEKKSMREKAEELGERIRKK